MKLELITKAKVAGIAKPIFKQNSGISLSLTDDGFEFVKTLYADVYVLYYTELRPIDLINMTKAFTNPYYIDKKKSRIFHFDEVIDMTSQFYDKDIRRLLEASI